MKRLEAEKKVLKKCAKKWLAMLMASLAFSVSAPAGFSVYAEGEQEKGEADTEDSNDTGDRSASASEEKEAAPAEEDPAEAETADEQ